MKILYLDCSMGAAGDMLTAALTDLMPDAGKFIEKLNGIGIEGVEYICESSVKCGITGKHITVKVNGEEEEPGDAHEHHHEDEHDHHDHEHEHEHHHDHEHDHEHEHDHHHHHHSSFSDIRNIISGLKVSDKVKEDALGVYKLIAEAESASHGVPVSEIHFHEVGTMDAVADVTAVCLAMEEISPDRVIVSPVNVGSGHVHCAHGILPVPAPATAYILKDVPIYSGHIQSELCTPTGAALLRYFADEFGSMPSMTLDSTGYGMGKKDFEQANCVRAMLGHTGDGENGEVSELCCNIDDMTGEDIGYAFDLLLGSGALDVWTEPIGMKKNRPGVKLCVLCDKSDSERFAALMLRHTTTIGVRETAMRRYTLERTEATVETEFGSVRVKRSSGFGIGKEKPEFDDIARIAGETGKTISEIRKELDK